jgi:phage terminase large subunit-like protein
MGSLRDPGAHPMTNLTLPALGSFAPPPPRPWASQARPEQLPPAGGWYIWLMLAGRGWGKTRTGAEWTNHQAMTYPGTDWAVVAKTFGAARDVCVEGPSGLLKCALPGEIVRYTRTLGQLAYSNGSKVYALGAEDADRLRGYNLAGAWADELAAWDYPETWHEGLVPAVRDRRVTSRIVVTTTPKPKPLVKDLLGRTDGSVVLVKGSTSDNAANLSESALAELHARYAGTRIGRQELEGELLDDIEGALWTVDMVDLQRVTEPPHMDRVVIGIDPAVTSTETSDETGLVAVGVTGRGPAAQYYVLEDRSGRYTPQQWATVTVSMVDRHKADRAVAEVNNGGDMVETVLRTVDPNLPVRKVHATRGKKVRAEPVAALYEQGRVHHVGVHAALEDQMTTWDVSDPRAKSPDRVDALVWAVTELMSGGRSRHVVYATPKRTAA